MVMKLYEMQIIKRQLDGLNIDYSFSDKDIIIIIIDYICRYIYKISCGLKIIIRILQN